MKSLRYSKNMVKSALKKSICSLLLLSLLSCSTSTTYTRDNIDKVLKDICRKEFNLSVNAWDIGDTLWIYIPVDRIIDDDNQIDTALTEDIRRIFLSLERVFLSLDTPPKFYCLVFSDIKTQGVDLYYVGFVPDLIKYRMGLISINDMRERQYFLPIPEEKALGDTVGKHISKYNLNMGEFISYLIRQKIIRTLGSPEVSEKLTINNLQTYYSNGKLGIMFDIEIQRYDGDIIDPFQEVKNAVKQYLTIYDEFEDVVEIEITDTLNKRSSRYTKRAILEDS